MYHKEKEFSTSPLTSLVCDLCHSCSAEELCVPSKPWSLILSFQPSSCSQSFQETWRSARKKEGNLTMIPKGSPSADSDH